MKEAKSLEEILKNVIKILGGPKHINEEDMCEAWKGAAGAAAAGHSRPVVLKKASLIVNVDGSSWLYELTTKKKDILTKMQAALKGKKLKEIRFRIGAVKKT
jgi:predicted nucleic acid-binding Zn ribbon protein